MHLLRSVLLLVLSGALSPTSPLQAQYPLELWVRDQQTREPIQRLYATHEGSASSVVARGLGIVRFRSLPPGLHRIVLTCETRRRFAVDTLLEREFAVPAPGPNAYVVQVDASGCDQRPVGPVRLDLRGFLELGFEHSRFVVCATDHALLPRDFEEVAHDSVGVWTEFPDVHDAADPEPWPAGEDHGGYRRWYVELSGALSGPGHYGHLGMSEYHLMADSLRVIRTPGLQDCMREIVGTPRSTGKP